MDPVNKQDIKNTITKILDDETITFQKKAYEIYSLSGKMSAQVGFDFLDVYSDKFNESVINRMESKDVARILSASFPFNVPEFVKFIGQDPERIAEFARVCKKFVKSFPYTHMEVMKIYHLPALTASFFFGDESVREVFQKMDAEVNDHHYGIMISSALLSKRDESLMQIITGMNPVLLTPSVLFEVIDAGNYNHKIINTIMERLNLSMDKPVSFSGKNVSVEMTLPSFVAYKAVTTGSQDAFDLFEKLNKEYRQTYIVPSSIKKDADKKISASNLIELVNKVSTSRNKFLKIVDNVLEDKMLSPAMYTEVFVLMFDSKNHQNMSIDLISKILSHPTLDSSFLNKTPLFEKALNSYINDLNSESTSSAVSINKTIFNVLKDKMGKDLENYRFFRLIQCFGMNSFPENNELAFLVKKDLIDNFEVYKEFFSLENGEPLKMDNSQTLYFAYQFLENQGFIEKDVNVSQVGGFFNKKTVKEDIVRWNDKVIKNRDKFGKPKKEVYSFLTTDSGETMDLSLIETLPNKRLKTIADNLVMMAYQFSNFSNDPLFSYSEESHFLKNNLPMMFNRIIGNYSEFKAYDEVNALESLTAQMLMLQKKAGQCIKIVVKDEHQDLQLQSDIQTTLLRESLAMNQTQDSAPAVKVAGMKY